MQFFSMQLYHIYTAFWQIRFASTNYLGAKLISSILISAPVILSYDIIVGELLEVLNCSLLQYNHHRS